MGNILAWIGILSFMIKMAIHISVERTKNESVLDFFFNARIGLLVLLPMKKSMSNQRLRIAGDICLIIFYTSLFLVCLIVFLEHN